MIKFQRLNINITMIAIFVKYENTNIWNGAKVYKVACVGGKPDFEELPHVDLD